MTYEDTRRGLEASAVNIVLVPHEVDEKISLEIGVSVMLDKPTVLIVRPGVKVPGKLAAIADYVIEADDIGSEDFGTELRMAISKIEDEAKRHG